MAIQTSIPDVSGDVSFAFAWLISGRGRLPRLVSDDSEVGGKSGSAIPPPLDLGLRFTQSLKAKTAKNLHIGAGYGAFALELNPPAALVR